MITKTILTSLAILTAITVPTAFAAESFPNWNTHDSWTTSGCGSNCVANSAADGVNDVYAKCTGIGCIRTSIVTNNGNYSPYTTTSALEISTTSSDTKVGMEIDLVFDGQMTTGFGSVAEYEAGLNLFKKSGSNWNRVGGCYDTWTAASDLTQSPTLSCNIIDAGPDDFRAGAEHRAKVQNWNLFVTTIVDFEDSGGSDTNKAETDRLEICAGVC